MIRLGSECVRIQYAVCVVISKTTVGCVLNWIVAMSSGLIIGLSLGFMIFVIVSTVVHLKRRAKANKNLGYSIHEGVGAGKFDLS